MAAGWTIVLDVGKTHSKATLWDESGHCIAQRTHTNQRLTVKASLTLDVSGIEQWLAGVLAQYATLGPVRAIVPVAHGAGVALLNRDRLQCAPLDYEWIGVAADRAAYDAQRDPFALTGSPRLPAGLNLGMQLHWLESSQSADFPSGTLVPWAQYWAWVLCGVAASEVTSLGCHSDLWRPYQSVPSALAVHRGWADRLAPLTPANQVLGTLRPEWAVRTGLSPRVEVYCGLHDSNAALLDARTHQAMQGEDSTVLSTGTWFVAMRTPRRAEKSLLESLPEQRDCLVNVDVGGAPVPSSRFMGGREIEILAGTGSAVDSPQERRAYRSELIRAIQQGEMILPAGVHGVGPYPNAKRPGRPRLETAHPLAHAHLYAALLADVSLDLIGSRGTLLIEGRFAAAPGFVQALASLRPSTQVLIGGDENGVARGALRLANAECPASAPPLQATPLAVDIRPYRERWREAAERMA
jgi:sugar (pentulose or hexulose) kinase